jgi:hypothetical protein
MILKWEGCKTLKICNFPDVNDVSNVYNITNVEDVKNSNGVISVDDVINDAPIFK